MCQGELFEVTSPFEGKELPQIPATLWQRLARSDFRRKMHLNQHDYHYLTQRGWPSILRDGEAFIRKRLAPAYPVKDGKQTPWRGHPVFVAQHATGNCCRSCLYKWHGISKGKQLTRDEQLYMLRVIAKWLENEQTRIQRQAHKQS